MTSPSQPRAASGYLSPLHDAGYLDDDLLEGPEERLGRRRDTQLMAEAFGQLLARVGAHRLARLGGSEPDLRTGA